MRKTVEIHTGSKVVFICFLSSSETQLNSNTPEGRQLLSAMNSISLHIENGSGNCDYPMVNGGRAYLITVSGKY